MTRFRQEKDGLVTVSHPGDETWLESDESVSPGYRLTSLDARDSQRRGATVRC